MRTTKNLVAAIVGGLGGGVGRSAEGKISNSGTRGSVALGVALGHAAISRADNACNGFIDFEYPVAPPRGGKCWR